MASRRWASALLTAATVDVRPSGDPTFTVDGFSVRFQLDNAGLLHISLTVHSHAAVRSTVTMTATLLDPGGGTAGQAVGGAVNVDPGASQPIALTGNKPSGVIAVVNLAIAGQPAPTPQT